MSENILNHITVDVDDDVKSVKIKNNDGKLMFIVSFITLEDDGTDNRYLVKVREVSDIFEPKDVVREYFNVSQRTLAIETMKRLVSDYASFVKTIVPPIDPRKVFNDSVNYRIIDPDCCKNCEYAVFHDISCDSGEKITKVFCTNRNNIKQYRYTHDIIGKYEEMEYGKQILDCVEVSLSGICNNYYSISQDKRG